MKKYALCLSATLLMAIIYTTDSLASTVKQLDIRVILTRDGSAFIEEYWDIDLTDSDAKTEWYVAHKGLGDMQIEGLEVEGYIPDTKGMQPFETLKSWDIDASRKEKAGKCGLNNNGTEICWGFGSYGHHEYVVRYWLTHLVKRYDTNDGFNHCFVDLNCDVEQAQVRIMADDSIHLSEANTRRWAFGYQGSIVFDKDGSIVATPEEVIGHSRRIIIMLEFDKGLFQPDTEASESWAERKQRALEGADYDDDNDDMGFWDIVLLVIVIIGGLIIYGCTDLIASLLILAVVYLFTGLWWVVSLAPLRNWYRRRRLGIAKGRYFRSIKPQWTLINNMALINELNYVCNMKKENVVGSVLLRLMSRGDVGVVRTSTADKGAKDMLKVLRPLKEVSPQTKDDELLRQHVLTMLTEASGKDLTLQPKEFSQWSKNHRGKLKSFAALFNKDVQEDYINNNAADLFALRSFLKDFTLLNERGMMEVKLWDEYMVYAEFFGLADEVRSDMARICPEYINMSLLAQSMEVATSTDVAHIWGDAIFSAANDAVNYTAPSRSYSGSSHSSSGHSSHSSRSGGGGYSGGGGGGGR